MLEPRVPRLRAAGARFTLPHHEDTTMTECIQVGQDVPDFELTTYDPKTSDFGTFKLAENKKAGRWTLLFFYPADFTFV